MHGLGGVLTLLGGVGTGLGAAVATLAALADDPAAFALGGGIIGIAVWLLVRTTLRQDRGWAEALDHWQRIAEAADKRADAAQAECARLGGALRERDAMIRERDARIAALEERIADRRRPPADPEDRL